MLKFATRSSILFFTLSFISHNTFAVVVPTAFVNVVASTPACTKALTESGYAQYANFTFYDFNGSTNTSGVPGILCPGTYQLNVVCTAYFGGGCGGDSCGWGINVSATNISSGGGDNVANTNASHDGCWTSHNNPCENQTIHMWSSGSFSTAKDKNLSIYTYQEPGNNVNECYLSAQYTGTP